MAVVSFADRLWNSIQQKRTPVLVGLDPRYESLPEPLQAAGNDATVVDRAEAYTEFCRGVIDVVAPLVPAVKPQAAFFEEIGPAGMVALAEVIDYAQSKGLMVILDGKRNDIGSTATAYATGLMGAANQSPWNADALTVSPYLGDDSLTPFVEVAQAREAGIFVLVKTSNPGGKTFQDLQITDGRPLYLHVAELVERLASETLSSASAGAASASGYGAVGAVVGATYPAQLAELRAAMPHTMFLVPGFGAQGGTASDVAAAFDPRGGGAIVNNSRSIIFAHARQEYAQFGHDRWQAAVEAATLDMIAQLRAETPAGNLGR